MKQFFKCIDRRSQKFVFVIDKLELAIPFSILVIKNTDCIMVDLMFHKSKRHDRKNLVIKHCIQKCTGTVGFPDCLDRNLMSGDIFLKELSSSASLLTSMG